MQHILRNNNNCYVSVSECFENVMQSLRNHYALLLRNGCVTLAQRLKLCKINMFNETFRLCILRNDCVTITYRF